MIIAQGEGVAPKPWEKPHQIEDSLCPAPGDATKELPIEDNRMKQNRVSVYKTVIGFILAVRGGIVGAALKEYSWPFYILSAGRLIK